MVDHFWFFQEIYAFHFMSVISPDLIHIKITNEITQEKSNICQKQIHDVESKVYLHTYNNEKKGRGHIKKNPGFRTRNLPRGRRTLYRLSYGAVSVPPEN